MTAPFFLLRNSRTLIVVWALTALVALAALVGATDGRPVSMSGASAPAATSGSVEPGLAALAQPGTR